MKLDVDKNRNEETRKPPKPSNVPAQSVEDDRFDIIDPEENELVASESDDLHDLHIHVPSHKCYTRWSPAELSIV